MKVYLYCLVAALLGTTVAWGQGRDAPRGRTEAEEGVEVLTRGPVHEAFAETVTFDPEPGVVVEKPAPEAIEELPPEQKPEGANVAWIPGYWGWDDERSDFLWVSGIWRSLPPGRQWVSGYWATSDQGSQWTSGYWADATASEIDYLPEPPQTVEAGPNIDAPSADHTWLPGCWVWHQSRYAWQPGYWATAQPNWVWMPAHYVWAPRGYVFVDGYWDYSVARRGVLFAPVYFNAGVYSRRGFSYSPATVINLAALANHLFLRPQYQHYYFGDYYAANYHTAGFYPSYAVNSGRYGYDPLYAHQRWEHRQDREWEHRVAADFQNRRDHEDARPPRTWVAQQALGKSGVKSGEKSLVVAASLDQLAKSKESAIKFRPVDKQEREKLVRRGQEIQKSRDQRQKLETTAAATSAAKPAADSQPIKVKRPTSPIVAKSAADLGKDHAPPQRHEVLKPVLDVEPQPRKVGAKAESPKDEPKASKREPAPARKVEPKPTPKVEPKSTPKVEPKPTPKVEPKPAPKGDRPARKPQPQPKVDRPAAKSQPQPKVDRPVAKSQPQPKVDRPVAKSQPQPKAGRPAPPPGAKQGKEKGKEKEKDKN